MIPVYRDPATDPPLPGPAAAKGPTPPSRSEALLRLVWENSADGMRVTDASGTVRLANPAYCRLVGLPRDRVEGRSMADIYAPDRRGDALAKYRARFAARS